MKKRRLIVIIYMYCVILISVDEREQKAVFGPTSYVQKNHTTIFFFSLIFSLTAVAYNRINPDQVMDCV